MGNSSGWHWIVVIALFAIIAAFVFFASEGKKQREGSGKKEIMASDAAERDMHVQAYVRQGYASAFSSSSSVMLSRPIKLNWPLLIILLFLPIVGWAVIIFIILRNKHAVDTVTIKLRDA